jgi:UPF0716 protein FxsA
VHYFNFMLQWNTYLMTTGIEVTMIKRFGLILILFFILEIAVIILVGKYIGIMLTLLLLIAAALAGVIVLRNQKIMFLAPMVQAGQITPILPNVNLSAVLGGIFLIIPGFISDFIAILLFIPVSNRLFCSKCVNFFSKHFNMLAAYAQQTTTIQDDVKRKLRHQDID